MTELLTERTTLRRLPKRGAHDRNSIDAILDEALVCHVGFSLEGQPYVIPSIHGRAGDRLYIHGSAASRMLRTLSGGLPVCVAATLLDGLVMARSAFHHSMNYRSVVVLGSAHVVEDPDQKMEALRVIVEHVSPGRWPEVRWPTDHELKATLVLELPIEEASAKIRTGPPIDDEEDYALSCWAGVIPLRLTSQPAVPDPRISPQAPPAPVFAGPGRG